MNRQVKCLIVVVAGLWLAVAGAAWAKVEIRALAVSGQRAPDGQGTISGFGHGHPYLNNRGQAVFLADVHAPRADMDHHAVLRSDAPGELVQLLRTGQALPGTAAGFGWLHMAEEMCLNDAGQLAVHVPVDARHDPLGAIYRIEPDGAISLVYRSGHGGMIGIPNWPIINGRGQVAFEVMRDDEDPDERAENAIYRADGEGALTRLAGQGDRVDATLTLSPGMNVGSSLSEAGEVSLFAFLNPDDARRSPSQGYYRTSSGELIEIARREGSTGAPEEVWEDLAATRHTQINEHGQVVFYGQARTGPRAMGTRHAGRFLHDGEGVVELVRRGQGAPDGNGSFERIATDPALNDAGQVAFGASLTGTRQRGSDDQGVFLAAGGGNIVQLVRSGQSTPEGDGVFAGSFSLPAINAQGQAAFAARLTGESHRGLFVADPDGTIHTIVRVGQTLPEGRVTDISFAGNAPGRNGFNDAGQVVFHARLEHDGDDREGIFLATPRGR